METEKGFILKDISLSGSSLKGFYFSVKDRNGKQMSNSSLTPLYQSSYIQENTYSFGVKRNVWHELDFSFVTEQTVSGFVLNLPTWACE